LRIAIVEDNAEDQETLCGLMSKEARKRGWAYLAEIYPSGEAFLSAAGEFDVVFLDVMMDGIDGMQTARKYRDKGGSALVVFVTVESDFAVEGYDVEAAAFLVKPVRPERFRYVIDRLARKLKKDVPLILAPDLEIPAGVVLYAAAADHCLKIHTAAKNYFPDFNYSELRTRLPDDGRFVECNRGVLINVDHVAKVDTKYVALDDGICLPVSRRRRQTLVDALATRKFSIARGDTP